VDQAVNVQVYGRAKNVSISQNLATGNAQILTQPAEIHMADMDVVDCWIRDREKPSSLLCATDLNAR
jgi:hypothetical protein